MLKPLSEISHPAPQFADLVADVSESGVRLMSIDDHHGDIAELELSSKAPDIVRAAFERAQHAYLYAWFSYDLALLAQVQAYAALELALRRRLGAKPDGEKWNGLAELMGVALSKGLFEGLPTHTSDVRLNRTGRVRELFRSIEAFRHDLTRGGDQIAEPGEVLQALRDCAAIIDYLFHD